MKIDFEVVSEFEREISSFYGAKFGIATDCCTHALELCLRLQNEKEILVPKHTYLSVPMLANKLGVKLIWKESEWQDYYYISQNIIDAAVFWEKGGYVKNTFTCLSFQYKKHLNLFRGGMILLNDESKYDTLKCMSYDGRKDRDFWFNQDVEILGYHYYMTPETAKLGLEKLEEAKEREVIRKGWKDYPDLTKMKVFSQYDK